METSHMETSHMRDRSPIPEATLREVETLTQVIIPDLFERLDTPAFWKYKEGSAADICQGLRDDQWGPEDPDLCLAWIGECLTRCRKAYAVAGYIMADTLRHGNGYKNEDTDSGALYLRRAEATANLSVAIAHVALRHSDPLAAHDFYAHMKALAPNKHLLRSWDQEWTRRNAPTRAQLVNSLMRKANALYYDREENAGNCLWFNVCGYTAGITPRQHDFSWTYDIALSNAYLEVTVATDIDVAGVIEALAGEIGNCLRYGQVVSLEGTNE